MAESARITLPDGSEATIEGPDREAIINRANRLRQAFQQRGRGRPEVIAPEPEQTQEQEPLGPGGTASGVGQTLLTLGTGAVAEPIAGLAGLSRGLVGGLTGEEDILSNMAETVRNTRGAITVEPFTESGRRVASTVAVPFEYFFDKARQKGIEDFERTGSPVVGAATQTGMEILPSAIGLRGAAGVPRGRVREAQRFAREEGINIGRRGEPLREEVTAAASRRADPERGRASEGIDRAVSRARDEAKADIKLLYGEARAKRAGVPVREAVEFPDLARRALADFDVEDMPKVQRRLQELDRLRELPRDSAVRLQEIDNFRKRINKNRAAATDEAQNRALDVLKAELDTFLESKFNTDMISGDPEALAAWQRARGAVRDYKRQFKEDKVIAQFARENATPEEIRQWIFGASSVSAKKQAGETLRKIKRMAGEESPEFIALRSDALFDVMRPLLGEEPNIKGFVNKFDRMVSENPSMANELFGESLGELRRLRDFAAAARKRGDPVSTEGLFNRGMSVLAVGHGIAKAGFKVAALQRLTRALGETVNKERFLREVFGTSVTDPYFGRIMRAEAGAQAGQELQEQSPRGSAL